MKEAEIAQQPQAAKWHLSRVLILFKINPSHLDEMDYLFDLNPALSLSRQCCSYWHFGNVSFSSQRTKQKKNTVILNSSLYPKLFCFFFTITLHLYNVILIVPTPLPHCLLCLPICFSTSSTFMWCVHACARASMRASVCACLTKFNYVRGYFLDHG